MKMHYRNGDTLGLIHSISTTAVSTHDIVESHTLLHGQEKRFFDDAGYIGEKNMSTEPQAGSSTNVGKASPAFNEGS